MALVEINRCFSPAEAMVKKSFLDQHGIQSFIPEWFHITAIPWYIVCLSGLRIMVHEQDADKALLLMGGEKLLSFENCPSCESHNVFRKPPYMLLILHFILIGVPYPINCKNRLCLNCNQTWSVGSIKTSHIIMWTLLLMISIPFFVQFIQL